MNETSLISVTAGEFQQERTLEVIAGEIRTYSDLLAKSAIEIGRRLCEAKEMVPHGQFSEWVKTNTGYSSSSASNFMRLFREFSTEQGSMFGAEMKCQTFGNLNYTKVLALVSLPESEREDFVVEHDVEHLSVREVERLVKERTAQLETEKTSLELDKLTLEKDIAEMQGELEANAEELKLAREHITQLQKQPVATVVERDEAAIAAAKDEGRAAASSEFKALLDDAEKELKEQGKKLAAAEKERDKAIKEAKALRQDMAQLDKAEAPAETVDKLRAQYEEQIRAAETRAAEAEKKMALSGKEIMAFDYARKRAYAEVTAMAENLKSIADPTAAAACRRAAEAMLEQFSKMFKEAEA